MTLPTASEDERKAEEEICENNHVEIQISFFSLLSNKETLFYGQTLNAH